VIFESFADAGLLPIFAFRRVHRFVILESNFLLQAYLNLKHAIKAKVMFFANIVFCVTVLT